jgi:hypothetical protein
VVRPGDQRERSIILPVADCVLRFLCESTSASVEEGSISGSDPANCELRLYYGARELLSLTFAKVGYRVEQAKDALR